MDVVGVCMEVMLCVSRWECCLAGKVFKWKEKRYEGTYIQGK